MYIYIYIYVCTSPVLGEGRRSSPACCRQSCEGRGASTYVYIYIYIQTYMHVYILCIHTCVCIYIYIYIHMPPPPREGRGASRSFRPHYRMGMETVCIYHYYYYHYHYDHQCDHCYYYLPSLPCRCLRNITSVADHCDKFSDWFYVWWRPHAAKGFIQNWILKYPRFPLREYGVMRIESCAHETLYIHTFINILIHISPNTHLPACTHTVYVKYVVM